MSKFENCVVKRPNPETCPKFPPYYLYNGKEGIYSDLIMVGLNHFSEILFG